MAWADTNEAIGRMWPGRKRGNNALKTMWHNYLKKVAAAQKRQREATEVTKEKKGAKKGKGRPAKRQRTQ